MIYVDPLFVWNEYNGQDSAQAARVGARHGHRWCHLWCDQGEEQSLHEFAEKLGMRRAWFQPKPGFPHYDLVPPKRAKAIALGAIEISLVDWKRNQENRRTENMKANSISGCLCHARRAKLLLLACLAVALCAGGSLVTADDHVIRDKDGKIIARITDSANGRVIRDANGKIIGKVDKNKPPKK